MPNQLLTPYLYSLNDLQKKQIAALLKLTEKQAPASFEALEQMILNSSNLLTTA